MQEFFFVPGLYLSNSNSRSRKHRQMIKYGMDWSSKTCTGVIKHRVIKLHVLSLHILLRHVLSLHVLSPRPCFTYMLTHIHTYIHTYIHTHIHTYTYTLHYVAVLVNEKRYSFFPVQYNEHLTYFTSSFGIGNQCFSRQSLSEEYQNSCLFFAQ